MGLEKEKQTTREKLSVAGNSPADFDSAGSSLKDKLSPERSLVDKRMSPERSREQKQMEGNNNALRLEKELRQHLLDPQEVDGERQKKVRIREAALDMRVRPEEGDTLRQEGMRVEREAQERQKTKNNEKKMRKM